MELRETTPSHPPTPQNMLDLVTSELSSPACRDKAELQAFYTNTLDHIRSVQTRDGPGSGLYANLRLP